MVKSLKARQLALVAVHLLQPSLGFIPCASQRATHVSRRSLVLAAGGGSSSSGGSKGFGKVEKPKPARKAASSTTSGHNRPLDTKYKAKLVKGMAHKFIELKNAGDWDTIMRLCADDVDVYGTIGREAVGKALKDFAASHAELHHALKDDLVALLGPGKVGYQFTKSWVDAATGERQEWVSFDESRNKMETLEFYADGRIKRMAIEKYDTWPPEDATLI